MAVITLPFVEPLVVEPPAVISIEGKVRSKPHRLNLNLTSNEKSNATRPLHISIRFDKQVIVFNSIRDGKWDVEETLKTFPFRRDSEFELSVLVTKNIYELSVDGKFVYAYKQRQPHNFSSVKFINLQDTTNDDSAPGFIVKSVKFEAYREKQKQWSYPLQRSISDTSEHDLSLPTLSSAGAGAYTSSGSVFHTSPST